MQARYFLYPALVLMVGCGADEQADKPAGAIPEYQLKALDKAKKVEDQLQESAEERAEQAETP